jgi:hypothetical protein
VAKVTHRASDGKWLSKIQDDVYDLMNKLQGELQEHALTVSSVRSERDREFYEEMKQLHRFLVNVYRQISTKRRLLRHFSQYIMGARDFNFLKKLSQGSFCTVYLATRKDIGRVAAIKVSTGLCPY